MKIKTFCSVVGTDRHIADEVNLGRAGCDASVELGRAGFTVVAGAGDDGWRECGRDVGKEDGQGGQMSTGERKLH